MLKQDKPHETVKPMMNDECITLIEKELVVKGQDLSILEWGSGGSTIYFSELLARKHINFRWDSIEHDPRWYCNVQDINKLIQVKLHLFMVGNPADKEAVAKLRLEQYVNFPRSLRRKYDIIIVDGRRRNECLAMAKRFLKEDGIVLLHDAERTQYHESLKQFKGEFLCETLWKGKL